MKNMKRREMERQRKLKSKMTNPLTQQKPRRSLNLKKPRKSLKLNNKHLLQSNQLTLTHTWSKKSASHQVVLLPDSGEVFRLDGIRLDGIRRNIEHLEVHKFRPLLNTSRCA